MGIQLRRLRGWFYRRLAKLLRLGHRKRIAGYERRWNLEENGFTKQGFFRVFLDRLLAGIPPGVWVELQAGDGLVGSLGAWLEQVEGWKVEAWEHRMWPAASFRRNRPLTRFHQERLISWIVPGAPKNPVGVTTRGAREAAGVCRAIRQGLLRPWLVAIWNPSQRPVWYQRLEREKYRLELVWNRMEFYRSPLP